MAPIIRSHHQIDIPRDKSISQLILLENVSNAAPDKIVYEDTLTGRTFTYDGFRLQVRRTAFWLKNTMSLKPGQMLSIMAPSCIDYLVAIHAYWWARGIVSVINHSLHASEIHHALEQIEPDFLLFHDQSHYAVVESFDRHHEHQIQIITFGKKDPRWMKFLCASNNGEEMELVTLGIRDTREVCMTIVLSSGTTGSPKAVMLSH